MLVVACIAMAAGSGRLPPVRALGFKTLLLGDLLSWRHAPRLGARDGTVKLLGVQEGNGAEGVAEW